MKDTIQEYNRLTVRICLLATKMLLFISILTFAGTSYAGGDKTFSEVLLKRNALEICISPKEGLGFAIIREDPPGSQTYLYRTKDYGNTWEQIQIMIRLDDYTLQEFNDIVFFSGLTIKSHGDVMVTAYYTGNVANSNSAFVKYGKRKVLGTYNKGATWYIYEEFDGDSDNETTNERLNRGNQTKCYDDILFISKDSGNTWKSTAILLSSRFLDNTAWIESKVSVNGKTIVVSNPNIPGKIHVSTNGGEIWTEADLSRFLRINCPLFSLDIASNGYIFASSQYGQVVVSKDNGITWTEVGSDIGDIYDICVYEDKGQIIIFLATRQGIKRAEYEVANLLTATTSKANQKTVATTTVDENMLNKKLNKEGNKAVLTITDNTKADVMVAELNGQVIRNMERKQAIIEVKNELASYKLPAKEININNIFSQIGANVELREIKVKVMISKSSEETVRIFKNSAKSGEYTIVAPPVDFSVIGAYKDRTVEVNNYNNYVERTISLSEGIGPSMLSTGVVLNNNGILSHEPSKIVFANGKYYIKINSLTNGSYSAIWFPKTFKDVEKHWSRGYVNEMASRLIINGIDKNSFAPDRQITGAELVLTAIRALGLKEFRTDNKLSSDWFYGAVRTAYQYGIISGYGDGSFVPNRAITREESMAIMARAMRVAGIDIDIPESETNILLNRFKDKNDFSSWTKSYAAACIKYGIVLGSDGMIKPKEYVTRAEAAIMLTKVMRSANLL